MEATFRNRPVDIGRLRARELRQRFARELRVARITAGLSQRQLARRARVNQSFVSAVERGVRGASLEVAARLVTAAGCKLGIHIYPGDGIRLRDSGQLAVAEAILASASPLWQGRLEVPVSSTDRRAADLVLEGREEVLIIEIERGLYDMQAQHRAANLKRDALASRYSQPVRLVIAVPDRRSTRAVVAQLGAITLRALPVGSARIKRSIRTGEPIGGDGIMFWPAPTRTRT